MPDRVLRARGRRRREELLRAALDVIGEHGVAATTHRAVAAAAGVPVATTTYYFSSIDELLEAALERFVEEEIAGLVAVGERVLALEGTIDDVVRAVAGELVGACSAAQFELYVEAARRPALREVVERSLQAYRALAEELLVRMGCPEPARVAPLVVALLDGLGVQHVAVPDADREQHLIEGITALLAPYGVGAAATA